MIGLKTAKPNLKTLNGFCFATLVLCISACGSSEEEKSATNNDSQRVFDFPFSDGESGSQYLFLPYITGTDDIEGKQDTSAAIVEVQASGATVKIDPSYGLRPATALSLQESHQPLSDAIRHFLNRADPNDEKATRLRWQKLAETITGLGLSAKQSLNRDLFRILSPSQKIKLSENASLTQNFSSCPETVLLPTDSQDEIDTSDQIYFDEDDYCLVFVGETSRDEPSNDNIKSSIANALTSYKLIFDDEFNQTIEGSDYRFKPLIIVVDSSSSSTYWPQSFKDAGVAGAYISSVTDDHNRPTIYMASDLSNVGINSNRRAFFHSTLGHELFHAIFDHFRVQIGGGEQSIPVIDEGLAHFFEDLLGYGELNFATYAGRFLAAWRAGMAVSELSIFDNATIESASSEALTIRGAGHTLMYYLVSQAGGIEFTNGKPSGGGGLKFLQALVKGTQRGPWSLGTAMDSDWPSLFGQYLGALAVDNSSFASSKFSVQTPVNNITDLQGVSTKTFGMRFNDFGDLLSVQDLLSEDYFEEADSEVLKNIELNYYHSLPILITIDGPASSVTFVFETSNKNAGVSFVEL